MIERYYAMQHIYLFISHPPKVPFSLVPYTFSFTQLLHASHLFLSQTTKPGEEIPSHKLRTLQGSPKKAQSQDLALAPVKRAFFSIKISSVLVPGFF